MQKKNLITAIQIALRENNLPVISEVCLYFEYKLYIELLKLMETL
jgi:L-asparaginase